MVPTRLELAAAIRTLFRRPGFAAVTIGTIAFAIAATTAIASIVNGVLLRPLPFREPERQVTLDARAPTGFTISTSIPNYRDWRDRSRSFASYAGSAGWTLTLSGQGPAEEIDALAVLDDFFGSLGLVPDLGRGIAPAEAPAHAGGASVAVLGHRFWAERLGADRGVIGRALLLDGRPYTVIGVLPRGSGYPDPGVAVYLPMATIPDLPWDDRDSGFGTRVIARLAPGVTLDAARSELTRVGRDVAATAAGAVALPEIRLLSDFFTGRVAPQLLILLGAVGLVLLIAVANVGNLLLARGEDRQRELIVRAALGADRGGLVRLLLLEALLIAAVGGAVGVGLAHLALGALLGLLPDALPALVVERIRVDAGVAGFGVGLALLAGVVFGVVPAIRGARSGLAGGIRTGGRTVAAADGGFRAGLVVTEIALALVLLVSAGLMLRSLDRLNRVDKGFDPTGVLTAAAAAPPNGYPDAERWRAFYRAWRDRAAALPGVERAALALLLPLGERNWERRAWPEGIPPVRETGQSVLFNVVSTEYFTAMGVPILRGRGFTEEDRDGAALVAMIDETMAARFWPGADPIGQRITIGERDSAGVAVYRTVVGVTRNLRHYELTAPSRIQVYLPFEQTYRQWGMSLRLIVKTTGSPMALAESVRGIGTELDPDSPVSQIRPLDALVGGATARSRAITRLLSGFGAAALGLAGLGVFAVMSYMVARRTREIGIRMALGASSREVVGWIGGRALRLTVAGVALGVVGSLTATRALGTVLFEVDPLDPASFAAGVVVLGGIAMAAAVVPARRAARVDPATTLGVEG